MKRVLLIPHDDRPPNLQFPRLLGRIAGISLFTPPRKLLGSCGRAGDIDAVSAWAASRAEGCEAVLVSLNFATCGGLVPSRTAGVSREAALSRLGLLKRIRAATPRAKLFAFGSITKSRGVVESPQEHNRARQRNLECFERAIQLTAAGVIDYLALGQDDAQPGGDHVQHRARLRALADRLEVSGKVSVMCGTDETAMLLLARASSLFTGLEPAFRAEYCPRKTAALVPLFEDEPVAETLSRQIACAGGTIARDLEETDCVINMLGPQGEQQDAFEESPTDLRAPDHVRSLLRMLDLVPYLQAKPMAACDIVTANGGTPALLDPLRRLVAAGRLHSYAAWNTSANTIGTVIAHLSSLLTWNKESPSPGQVEAHAEFLNARFLDDLFYQGLLRSRLARIGSQGIDKRRPVVREVAEELKRTAFSKHSEHALPSLGKLSLERLHLSWPWKRPFEIELRMRYRPDDREGRNLRETERMPP